MTEAQKPSLDYIAKLAGVSKTTASLVINGKSDQYRISKKTERKIRSLVSKYAFRPSQTAIGLRLKSTKTIGLVIDDVTNYFYSLIAKHVQSKAEAHGFHIIIANSGGDEKTEKAIIGDMIARSVDGLMLASAQKENRLEPLLSQYRIPAVYIDRNVAKRNLPWVGSDNFAGSYLLAQRLICRGATKIVFVGGRSFLSTHQERLAGFKKALSENSIPFNRSLYFESDFGAEGGFQAAQKIFANNGPAPHGIFTASFTLCEGLLLFLNKKAPNLAPELKLATFDNHPLLDLLPFPVDSMQQDCIGISEKAFAIILDQIAGKKTDRSVALQPQLISRSAR